MIDGIYSVCVIGAGSAGVTAALRTVLNNDDCLLFPGTPKNKKNLELFGFPKLRICHRILLLKKGSRIPTRKFLNGSPKAHSKKSYILKNQGVTSLTKNSDGTFEIVSSSGEIFNSKFVILCTGVMDVQPEINGSISPILPYANVQLADYCLRCDATMLWEKNLTIFGNGDGAAWVGIMLKERYDCPKITILTNGEHSKPFSDEVQKLVNQYQFEIRTAAVNAVVGDKKSLKGYELSNGEMIASDFTFISLGMIVYNELAIQVGAEVDSRGFVITNASGESSIEGLFVAGDLRPMQKNKYIPHGIMPLILQIK